MAVNSIQKSFVALDNFFDYVPGVSSVTNLYDIFLKYVVLPLLSRETIEKNHFYKHIEYKDFWRCILQLLLI